MNEKSNKDNKELVIQHAYLDWSFYTEMISTRSRNVEYYCMARDVQRSQNKFGKSNVLEYRLILKIETTKVIGSSYFCHLRKFGPYIT